METEEDEFDTLSHINFDNLFDNIQQFGDDFFHPTQKSSDQQDGTQTPQTQTPSPDSTPFSIAEIEQILLKDDNEQVLENPDQYLNLDDFSEFLFPEGGEEIGVGMGVGVGVEVGSSSSPSEANEEKGGDQFERIRVVDDGGLNPDSSVTEEKDEKEGNDVSDGKDEDSNDPLSKKRKRQIRNRDAALRSRERKKLYVKDLEMKSRYLEGECIRLQRLLQCYFAENHALQLQLHMGKAVHGASKTKQESAVLLLESLLLGSLLWFLGIMGLCSLLPLLQIILPEAMAKVGSNNQEIVDPAVPRGAKSEKLVGLGSLRLFFKSKRCKATRSKMKTMCFYGAVLA